MYEDPDLFETKLPKVCIHNAKQDGFSSKYKPREVCKCGKSKWTTEGCTMLVHATPHGIEIYKSVHRCEACNEVRLTDLIKENNER